MRVARRVEAFRLAPRQYLVYPTRLLDELLGDGFVEDFADGEGNNYAVLAAEECTDFAEG